MRYIPILDDDYMKRAAMRRQWEEQQLFTEKWLRAMRSPLRTEAERLRDDYIEGRITLREFEERA